MIVEGWGGGKRPLTAGGAAADEELMLEVKAELPVGSEENSSVLSSRLVMVASTQLVCTEENI